MSGRRARLHRHLTEAAWGAFAAANTWAVLALDSDAWAVVAAGVVWLSLAVVAGLRQWSPRAMAIATALATGATGAALLARGAGLAAIAAAALVAGATLLAASHARGRRAALEALDEAAVRERSLLRDASRALRTPIAVAQARAEFIRADDPLGPTGADAAAVLDELAALTDISDRLHLLAVADEQDFLWPERTSLGRLVREAAERWRPVARRDWRVRIDVDAPVLADPARMAAALDAILENAVQHTPEGGRIAVAVGDGGPVRARLTVADAGRGIPADRLPRLFEPFGRSEQADGARRGSGLGLAVVRAVVEAHGGEVAVASREGFGTTVTLELPVLGTPAGGPLAAPERTPIRR